MIFDHIDNAEQYFDLNPHFARAFAFLRRDDLAELEPGKYEIDGDNSWALVFADEPKAREDGKLEAHCEYIDIQYTVSGTECMGWRATGAASTPSSDYDVEKDVMFFADDSLVWLDVPPAHFALFFPSDGHAPVRAAAVHKVVLKVKAH